MGRVPLIAMCLVVWSVSSYTSATPRDGYALGYDVDQEITNTTVQRGPVSLAQARQMALQRFPGRVIRAETVNAGGNRRIHQIRILDSAGRVRNARIDAQTGAFL